MSCGITQWLLPGKVLETWGTQSTASQPSLHSMSPAHAGLSPGQHAGGDREQDTGATPALGTPPGSLCATGEPKPRDGSLSVLGRSTAVGREADGKGRQTIISVFGSHSRVFSPPLSNVFDFLKLLRQQMRATAS